MYNQDFKMLFLKIIIRDVYIMYLSFNINKNIGDKTIKNGCFLKVLSYFNSAEHRY